MQWEHSEFRSDPNSLVHFLEVPEVGFRRPGRNPILNLNELFKATHHEKCLDHTSKQPEPNQLFIPTSVSFYRIKMIAFGCAVRGVMVLMLFFIPPPFKSNLGKYSFSIVIMQ